LISHKTYAIIASKRRDYMKTTEQEKFYTAKYDRIFKSIFLSENGKFLMKKLLETILEKEMKIIDYPPCDIPVTKAWEKVTTVDFIVQLENILVHFEIETGTSIETLTKNLNGFTKIYYQGSYRGGKYDTKTLFLNIILQYNLSKYRDIQEDYYIINKKRNRTLSKNFKIIIFNMDRIKRFWYTKDIKNIKKYLYLIMLDLPKEELEKIKEWDDTVKLFHKKITKLNDWNRFKSDMTMEEKEKALNNTILFNTEEKALKEGKKIGIETGKKEKEIEFVKNLQEMNMKIEDISKATKLSIKEINNIINETI